MARKLHAGDAAPNFSVTDINGQPFVLSERRDRPVLVAFLRYSGCPWCNLTLHRLILEFPLLQKENCDVVAFVRSSESDIQKHIFDRSGLKPPFPVIADPDKTIYKEYGIYRSITPALKAVRDIPAWAKTLNEHNFVKGGSVNGDYFTVPAAFLITPGPEPTIIRSLYDVSLYTHEAFRPVYEQLVFAAEIR